MYVCGAASARHTSHSYEKITTLPYVTMYECMYVTIRRPRAYQVYMYMCVCAHIMQNSLKIVNLDRVM